MVRSHLDMALLPDTEQRLVLALVDLEQLRRVAGFAQHGVAAPGEPLDVTRGSIRALEELAHGAHVQGGLRVGRRDEDRVALGRREMRGREATRGPVMVETLTWAIHSSPSRVALG